MDVRCDRCKTEYEFDEDRITEAGVAVKCTHCGYVFMVKKAAVVVTVPLSDDIDEAVAFGQRNPPSSPAPGLSAESGGKPRDWKVRQPNGSLITFKELTTLQKWIVERKINREDEISLTGESWKRLGNIAELASFFQVVDDAARAASLSKEPPGAHAEPYGMTPPSGVPRAPAEPGKASPPTQPIPPVVVSLEESIARAPATEESPDSRAAFENFSFPKSRSSKGAAGFETAGGVRIGSKAQEPAFTQRDPSADFFDHSDDELAAAAGVKKTPRLQLIVLIAVALGAVGYLAYRHLVWIPDQKKLASIEAKSPEDRPADRAMKESRPPSPVPAPSAKAPSEGVPRERTASDGTPAAQAIADAGPQEEKTAERPGPAPLLKSEDAGAKIVARADPGNFDSYMTQGDRLREREQAQPALEAYAKAAELEPNRAEPLAGRGLALLDLGKTVQAIAAFQHALRINSRYGLALMGLAEAYRTEGKKDEAVQYYEKYLEILPDGPEAPVARAAIKSLQE